MNADVGRGAIVPFASALRLKNSPPRSRTGLVGAAFAKPSTRRTSPASTNSAPSPSASCHTAVASDVPRPNTGVVMRSGAALLPEVSLLQPCMR